MNKKSNKLISLLITLSRTQRKSAIQFLNSPYFNKSKDLVRLFDELSSRVDRDKDFKKENIWKRLWPGKPYNDVRYRKFCSDLFKLIESFLIHERLETNEPMKELLYLEVVEKQKADRIKEGIDRNWEKLHQLSASEDVKTYLWQHLLEVSRYELLGYEQSPEERGNMEEINTNLDIYFLTTKLRFFIDIQSRRVAKKNVYDLKLMEEVISFLEQDDRYLNYLPVGLQFSIYKMLTETNDEHHYQRYKQLLFDNVNAIPTSELDYFYQVALNFCTRQNIKGKLQYLNEYLEIYQHALNNEALFIDGQIDPLQFKVTITTALRGGNFEWVKSYIEDYQQFIPKAHRENAVNYNSATLYFYQKNYNKALGFLRDVEYENVSYNLNSKTMLLAIYYETDEFDALESLFDAFLAYLNRHKELQDTHRASFRNLVSLTRKLTRIIPGDKTAVEKIKKEVENTRPVASLNWIKEKIRELE